LPLAYIWLGLTRANPGKVDLAGWTLALQPYRASKKSRLFEASRRHRFLTLWEIVAIAIPELVLPLAAEMGNKFPSRADEFFTTTTIAKPTLRLIFFRSPIFKYEYNFLIRYKDGASI